MTTPHNGPYGPPGFPGPPPPGRTNPLAVVAALVAVLAVAGLVVALLLVKGGDDSGGSSSAPPQGKAPGGTGSASATGPSPGSTDDTGPLGTARNSASSALRALQPDGEASLFGFYTCKQDNARADHGLPTAFRNGVQSFTVSDPKQAGDGEVHVTITAQTSAGSYGGTLVVVEENAWKACFSDSGTHIEQT